MSCCGVNGNGRLPYAGYGITSLGYGGFSPICRPFVYGNGCPYFSGPASANYNASTGTISQNFATVNGLFNAGF